MKFLIILRKGLTFLLCTRPSKYVASPVMEEEELESGVTVNSFKKFYVN